MPFICLLLSVTELFSFLYTSTLRNDCTHAFFMTLRACLVELSFTVFYSLSDYLSARQINFSRAVRTLAASSISTELLADAIDKLIVFADDGRDFSRGFVEWLNEHCNYQRIYDVSDIRRENQPSPLSIR